MVSLKGGTRSQFGMVWPFGWRQDLARRKRLSERAGAWMQVSVSRPSFTPRVAVLAAGLGVVFGVAVLRVDVRMLLATAIIGCVVLVAIRYPVAAAVGLLGFLPFLGLVRRLLISVSGWPTTDPLLLVAPVSVLFFLLFAWREGRIDLKASPLSLWLGLFAAWMFLEVANPSGGLLANGAGVMYTLIPLLWFYIGRAYGSEQLLAGFLRYVLVASVAIALYGLYQTLIGMPPWDQAWITIGGYAALNVGGVIRAFGTFPSSAEYGFCLGIGIVVAFTLLWRRRLTLSMPLLLAAIGILGLALFLESQRGVLLSTIAACTVVWATGNGGGKRVIVRLAVAAGVSALAYLGLGHGLGSVGGGGVLAPLVQHDTSFLASPFSSQSTLPGHLSRVLGGLVAGIRRPFGYGLGSISIASKFAAGSTAAGTEFDISNAFVAGGIPGGLMFLVVAFYGLKASFIGASTRHWELAATLGILIVVFGNWLNGGQYFVGALVWFILGMADRTTNRTPALDLESTNG